MAVDHAQAAGDADRVARLVAGLAQPITAAGRVDTVRGWLAWFEDQGLVEHYPQVAVQGTWISALWGQPAAAERWADAADRGASEEVLPDGSTMAGHQALLRALFCRGGVDQMRADARLGLAGLSPTSRWRAAALLLEAVSYLLDGEAARADRILARVVEVGTDVGALPAVSVALAERSLIAIQQQRWHEAEVFADNACTTVQTGHLDDYVLITLAYAVAARTAAHRGEAKAAEGHLARAVRLRPLLTHAMPHLAVQTLLELGRAYLTGGDIAGAKVTLREATEILGRRPSLGVLPKQLDELRSKVDTMRSDALGASSLTRAELRLIPLLSTHLTFREIGERLYISQNTVKKHAISVYQKFGVSSRSQAVQRAQEIGLGP